MITLSEEQLGRLLADTAVTISVGEPWDFESPDGENVLRGSIVSVAGVGYDPGEQQIRLEVTPFVAESGRTITRLTARRRYRDEVGIIERLASGEDAEVNLSYADSVPEAERDPTSSPFLIGGLRLAD